MSRSSMRSAGATPGPRPKPCAGMSSMPGSGCSKESDLTSTVSPGGGAGPAASAQSIVLTGGAGNVGRVLRRALGGRIGAVRILDIADPGPLAGHESWVPADITDLAAL